MDSSQGKAPAMNGESGEIEILAERGDCEAQIALARRCEGQDKTPLARGWFARAAKQGSVPALRSLAINLLTRPPIVERDGVNMIRAAAHRGDGEAAHVCAMLAAQDDVLEDRWNVARECLLRAAERGWEPAQAQLNVLGENFTAADAAALTAPLPARIVFDTPNIAVIEGFAAAAWCDWLIERARPRLAPAMVYDPSVGGGRIEQARSNSSIGFDVAQSDIVLMLLRARIAATANLSPRALEASAVLHYAPGQQFEPHFDFLDSGVAGYASDLAARGQRIATFLLYLNDDFEGGETEFPRLEWRYRGRKGDALMFRNVDPSGQPDPLTFHAGLPPLRGQKWLLSQWLRQRPAGWRGDDYHAPARAAV
jgi:prolyl 4-hydroxylase